MGRDDVDHSQMWPIKPPKSSSILSFLPLYGPEACMLEMTDIQGGKHQYFQMTRWSKGFPRSSAGKESACNAGDPSSIPGSGRSPGEGTGYPLQYSCTSLLAQMVKNPAAMPETWVDSYSGKIPWRRAWQPTPIFLPGESPWTEEPDSLQFTG